MAKGKVVGYAVKYGVKYGPHVLVAAKALQAPATAYAQRRIADGRARRAALTEAATLSAGTVLKVFHQGSPVWVVYTGDQPVSAHPPVEIGLDALVAHADLGQRVAPEAVPGTRERLAAAGGKVADQARGMMGRRG